MKKAWEWLIDDDHWLYVCGLILVLFVFGALVYAIATYTPLTEGVVENKFYHPAHNVYSPIHITINGKLETIAHYKWVGDEWTITVRNGDNTDIWYVSESYYDSVHVGDWVKK